MLSGEPGGEGGVGGAAAKREESSRNGRNLPASWLSHGRDPANSHLGPQRHLAVVHETQTGSSTPEEMGDEQPSIERLVADAIAGDRAAFGVLFERYAGLVHGVLLSRVDRREVRDLMQDVFVSALTGIRGLREPRAVGAWLATLARNRATDHLRTRKRHDELPDDLAVHHADRSEAEQVLTLIRALPEAYRETLVLRLVQGMSGPEIAAEVGLTPESVRVNLHRGMALLRERLSLAGSEAS